MGENVHKCYFLKDAKPVPRVLTDHDRMGINEPRKYRRGVRIGQSLH